MIYFHTIIGATILFILIVTADKLANETHRWVKRRQTRNQTRQRTMKIKG